MMKAMQSSAFLQDPKKQKALLITILVSGFTTMLNTSTVNIALPSFMEVFQTDIRMVQWLIVGYMLTLGMMMPMVGYFGERYSYRKLYLTALVVMGICAVGCVLANNIYALIACRMVKGAAAGFITPCTMTLLYKYIPKQKQANFLGLSLMAGSMGTTIGPTVAGFLLSAFNWHSLFLVNVPLVIIAFYLAYGSIPQEEANKTQRLDIKGIIMVGIGTALILIGFTEVEDWGWRSPNFYMMVAGGLTLIGAFIWMEYHSRAPLLNFKVFRYKPFAMTVIINCTLNMTFTITPLLMAVYLQTIQGYSPFQAGLILLLPSLCMVLGNFSSRLLIKQLANKWIVFAGLLIAAAGNFTMSQTWVDTAAVMVILFMSLRYLGVGLLNMPLTDYGMSIIPLSLSGHASAMLSWCRQVTSVIWLSMLTALLSFRMSYHYQLNGNIGEIVEGTAAYNTAEMQAVNDVFLTLVVVLVLVAIASLKMKNEKPCRDCEPEEIDR